MRAENLPLAGLRVLEFTHMVMGPSVGLILADLGADVTRVEPVGGDRTRELRGSGAGYFAMFNRNKRSICLNLKMPDGLDAARRLCLAADVVVENFRPGAMDRLGLGYDALREGNPRLVYCSAKGFLSGPFENRTALDEVAQMMGGLAYMTGPPGKPLRAGASVIDITGGMFGVIGILAALERRHRTGEGAVVRCSLFETTSFLVGQHIAQLAVTGKPAEPMPARVSAWAVYDAFDTGDREQIFLAVVSDSHWRSFCAEFELAEFAMDPRFADNSSRVALREEILPRIRAIAAGHTRDELLRRCESIGVPASRIARPQDLLDDEHLNAGGGFVDLHLPDGRAVRLPALAVQMGGDRFGVRRDLGAAGADSSEVLTEIGLDAAAISELIRSGAVA